MYKKRKRCFVAQPFDEGKYERRFLDIFSPAIKDANFEPYRVCDDHSVIDLIQAIGREIKESDICFAEITTNNPNVWYEVGYAFANKKKIILVCSDERNSFPFDVQNNNIIKYKTESLSSYMQLKEKITIRIKALDETTQNQAQAESESESEYLKNMEYSLCAIRELMDIQIRNKIQCIAIWYVSEYPFCREGDYIKHVESIEDCSAIKQHLKICDEIIEKGGVVSKIKNRHVNFMDNDDSKEYYCKLINPQNNPTCCVMGQMIDDGDISGIDEARKSYRHEHAQFRLEYNPHLIDAAKRIKEFIEYILNTNKPNK